MNAKISSTGCLGILTSNGFAFLMENLQLNTLLDLSYQESREVGFLKWNSLINLRAAGSSTSNAIFIKPYSAVKIIEKIIHFFAAKCRIDLIFLRPDGKCGIAKSPSGMQFGRSGIVKMLAKLVEWNVAGYEAFLVETYNQFDCGFCCNDLLDGNGDFVIEFVGPGLDGDDLNKAILNPSIKISSGPKSRVFICSDSILSEPNIEFLDRLCSRINIDGQASTEEIEIRLQYIMNQLLPDMGIETEDTLEVTKQWLKESSYARLLDEKILRSLKAKALTAHKYNGKIVFGGAYDLQKWDNYSSDYSGFSHPSKSCPLCDNGIELRNNHARLYGNEIEETNVLLETENFYVVIDNYPVCQDHILIIPKKHFLSFSVVDKELEYEFEATIKTLSDVVGTEKYGLFEHGSNMVGKTQNGCGNSVYHAHMHFIPSLNIMRTEAINLCVSGDGIILKPGYKFSDFCTAKNRGQTVLDYLKRLSTEEPYLFCNYSNIRGESLCIPDDIIQGRVPSQFFRRVFAEYFQKGSLYIFWNWKDPNDLQRSTAFRVEVIKKTIEKFKDKEKIWQIFQMYLHNKIACQPCQKSVFSSTQKRGYSCR